MDQLILKSVTSAGLPLESAEAIQSLFCNLSVSETAYVQFVNEDDLTGILKVVQARKLVAYWKSLGYVLKQFALQQVYFNTSTLMISLYMRLNSWYASELTTMCR